MENMSENRELQGGLVDANQRHLFIDGYFSNRAMAGERPTYGYPANHLPTATGPMQIKTSFFA